MSGLSHVEPSVHHAGDQRNMKTSEQRELESSPYKEGQKNSHVNLDSKDERSIANRLAAEEKRKDDAGQDDPEASMSKKDPTLPAAMHGNEPSKGAKVDAELRAEEEEILEKKGK